MTVCEGSNAIVATPVNVLHLASNAESECAGVECTGFKVCL